MAKILYYLSCFTKVISCPSELTIHGSGQQQFATGFAMWKSRFLIVSYFLSSVKWSKYMKEFSSVFYQLHLCSRFLLLRFLILGLICLPVPTNSIFLKNILKIYFWWWQVDIFFVLFSDLDTNVVLKANLDSLMSWFLFGKFWI